MSPAKITGYLKNKVNDRSLKKGQSQ